MNKHASQIVRADTTASGTELNRFFQRCIGSCHAYLTLREDFREHVKTAQQEIGFERIRCHGIFHDWVGVYHSDGETPQFNFQNVDKIYDFFLSQGMRPYVELSFMPQALASNEQTIFRYQANISPPRDYKKWNQLIHAFATHCMDRYGKEEVLSWYFEVWNEPDLTGLFWSGTKADYFELYKQTVTTLKNIDTRLKVGGPATARSHWIRDTLDYCATNDVAIDFISTHHYAADAALEVGGDVSDIAWRGQQAMRQDVAKTVEQVRTSATPDIEVHYTEWNVSPCHEDNYGKDSEFTAAFLLQTLKDMDGLVDVYSFWCISDIFEESGPGLQPFSGKYGLINLNGIKKPAFHAYRFLASLYDEALPVTTHSTWITKSPDNHFRILSWNFCEPVETNFNGGNYELDEKTVKQTITLENLRGRFHVKAYKVGKNQGNAYRAWQQMGAPQYPDNAQLTQLKQSSEPDLIVEEHIDCRSELVLTHQLGSCDIVFYDITAG